MVRCTLSPGIKEGFQKIEAMKPAEVDSLFSDYDKAVFTQPACADPDRYVLIAEQFQRHNKFDIANLALAKALLSGTAGQLPYLRISAVYSKMGLSEVPGIFKYVGRVQEKQATQVAFPQKGTVEYWQAVACDNDREQCLAELHSTQTTFTQNLRHQLLLSLYSRYYQLAVRPLEISKWLTDPMTIGAWQRDPKLVVEVLDYFIQKREIVLEDGDFGEMGNTLIVLRDLLKLTSQFFWTTPVHHDDLKVFFKPYYAEDGHVLTAVREGVAFYLLFLLMQVGGQVPDAELMAALKKLSSDQSWANRVEALAKSRQKGPQASPGRKKK